VRGFPLVLTVLTVGLMAGPTQAFKAMGMGTGSCGGWTAHRADYGDGRPITQNSAAALAEMQWVVGFLSGVGYVGSDDDDPLDGMDDPEGVWAWVDNYCRANPINPIERAATAFYRAHPHR
jgi:hypothetical protein